MVSAFPTRQVEELCGFLALNQGVAHSREKVINMLWPNYPTRSARGRFSTVLWRLKSVLADIGVPAGQYLTTTHHTIALEADAPLQIDTRQFQQKLLAAEKAPDEETREQALRAAAELYQGDLLDGLYADWCLIEREHLARLHLRAMGRLMACLMQRGAYEEAVTWGRKILGFDPLREEVHRAVMRCYWKMDRHSAAVRQFQLCTEFLEDELQIGPAPETVLLYSKVVADRAMDLQQTSQLTGRKQAQLQDAVFEFQQVVTRFDRFLDEIAQNPG